MAAVVASRYSRQQIPRRPIFMGFVIRNPAVWKEAICSIADTILRRLDETAFNRLIPQLVRTTTRLFWRLTKTIWKHPSD